MSSIYVVEDEGITGVHLRKQLQNLGYQVPQVIPSGEQALDLILESQPDLVLMDINLGGTMDGITTAKKIKEKTDLKVIFLTAYDDVSTRNRARKSGADGYIVKPIDRAELDELVRYVAGDATEKPNLDGTWFFDDLLQLSRSLFHPLEPSLGYI